MIRKFRHLPQSRHIKRDEWTPRCLFGCFGSTVFGCNQVSKLPVRLLKDWLEALHKHKYIKRKLISAAAKVSNRRHPLKL